MALITHFRPSVNMNFSSREPTSTLCLQHGNILKFSLSPPECLTEIPQGDGHVRVQVQLGIMLGPIFSSLILSGLLSYLPNVPVCPQVQLV